MGNILWDEWVEMIGPIAARWGADKGAVVGRNGDVCWTCPLGSLSVAVEPRATFAGMPIRIEIGSSSALSGNASVVRRRLQSGVNTIEKAEAAFCEVSHHVVWWRDCPCDSCSATGRTGYGRTDVCAQCGGTGKRQPADDNNEKE